MDKPIELRTAELALLKAYQVYDKLDRYDKERQKWDDAEQREKRGVTYCRAHPEDREAGVTLAQLRRDERDAYVAQVQAKQAYDVLHAELGADDSVWVLEVDTWRYMEEREVRHVA